MLDLFDFEINGAIQTEMHRCKCICKPRGLAHSPNTPGPQAVGKVVQQAHNYIV